MLFSHVANVAQLPLQIPLGWVMVPTWLRHSLRKGGTFAFAPSGDFGSLACRLVWQLHQSYIGSGATFCGLVEPYCILVAELYVEI